jgi:hypothetical protein
VTLPTTVPYVERRRWTTALRPPYRSFDLCPMPLGMASRTAHQNGLLVGDEGRFRICAE